MDRVALPLPKLVTLVVFLSVLHSADGNAAHRPVAGAMWASPPTFFSASDGSFVIHNTPTGLNPMGVLLFVVVTDDSCYFAMLSINLCRIDATWQRWALPPGVSLVPSP